MSLSRTCQGLRSGAREGQRGPGLKASHRLRSVVAEGHEMDAEPGLRGVSNTCSASRGKQRGRRLAVERADERGTGGTRRGDGQRNRTFGTGSWTGCGWGREPVTPWSTSHEALRRSGARRAERVTVRGTGAEASAASGLRSRRGERGSDGVARLTAGPPARGRDALHGARRTSAGSRGRPRDRRHGSGGG